MTRPITPEDLWNLYRVGQPEHIPGTTSVIVPVVDYHDDGKATSVLHRVDRDGTTVALTDRELDASSPIASPDGERIAFLSSASKDDPKQIHIMNADGSGITPVTDFPKGVSAMHWIPGADGLVAAVPLYRGSLTLDETTRASEDRKDKKTPVRTEDRFYRYWKRWLAGETIDHLFRIDLDGGQAVDLTPEVDTLIALDEVGGAIAVSPDGSSIIFTLDVGEPSWDYPRFQLHSVPVAGGEVKRMATGKAEHHARPRISPDGSTLVYGATYEHAYYADHVRLVSHHLGTGTEQIITSDWDRSAGGWEFINDDSLVFHAEDEGHVRLFTIDLDGGKPLPITSTGSNHGPRIGLDCFWHRTESMHRPAEIAITATGHTTTVSGFNADLVAELELRPAKEIRVTGSRGKQIQVFVVEPPKFDNGTQWPLLQNVHGGPHNGVTDSWHWRWNPQVMAAPGRVVVSVNFHGSSSFGDEFTRSIRGAWGEMPFQDIEATTDHMLNLGFIDEDRMAIAGGSYGGYLVTWITTKTNRYQTSICHAGVTDLLGQWASDLTEGREMAIGGVPWDDMDAVQRWSPMAHTHDIETPTLVIHGELDYRVVITQGLELYGLLKHKGVPARLVYFPDEGHWIEKQPNAMVWWDEFLTWLERWGA
jgi:dipeptidyl aminopeptidase/acylaminoacyl peptidase